MKITGNIVTFRSISEYYKKEVDGKKANTIRIISDEEDILIQMSELDYIKIINVETNDVFYRRLTDITRFIHNDMIIYIFSWKHT